MDRRTAPFKRYVRPAEKMACQTSYTEDFVKQEVEKPAAIRPVEEFHMQHDYPSVLRSEAHEQFNEKTVSNPNKTYNVSAKDDGGCCRLVGSGKKTQAAHGLPSARGEDGHVQHVQRPVRR